MIVGHLGVAAGLARWRPRVSLWWLFPAAIAPDLLDLVYAAAGVCNPFGLYSHTVPAALLLGVCIAGGAVLAGRRETSVLVLLVVLLHLPMDFFTGRKLYWPGSELYGLMLYSRRLADFALESAILVAGWALLRRSPTAPRWATSVRTLAACVALQGTVDGLGVLVSKPNGCGRAWRTSRTASLVEQVMPPHVVRRLPFEVRSC